MDKIYYQIAILQEKKDSLALAYFDLSNTSNYLDRYTQIENYQDLAEYHFKEGDYLISGNYLDKLLPLYTKFISSFLISISLLFFLSIAWIDINTWNN